MKQTLVGSRTTTTRGNDGSEIDTALSPDRWERRRVQMLVLLFVGVLMLLFSQGDVIYGRNINSLEDVEAKVGEKKDNHSTVTGSLQVNYSRGNESPAFMSADNATDVFEAARDAEKGSTDVGNAPDHGHLVVAYSGLHLQENALGVNISVQVQIFPDATGRVSATVPERTGKCPFPHVTLRLSGSALIRVPLLQQGNDTNHSADTTTLLEGCFVMPVPGLYYIDAHLTSCTIDVTNTSMSANETSQYCYVPPLANSSKYETFTPLNFTITRQHMDARTRPYNQTKSLSLSNPDFPQSAWIYAPYCDNDKENPRSPNCTEQSYPPPFLSTRFQIDFLPPHFLPHSSPEKMKQYDSYVWMEINTTSWEPIYNKSHYVSPQHADPPNNLHHTFWDNITEREERNAICFIGASHGRYLRARTIRIITNSATGTDPCAGRGIISSLPGYPSRLLSSRFPYIDIKLLPHGLGIRGGGLTKCRIIIVTYGQHSAGKSGAKKIQVMTPPHIFEMEVERLLRHLGTQVSNNTVPIWLLTTNANPMGYARLECPPQDWRVPVITDAYNDAMKRLESAGRLRPHNARILDNTDMMEPMWDSADDWCHPCRHVFRPMAIRVLKLYDQLTREHYSSDVG